MTENHKTTELAKALWQRLSPGKTTSRVPTLCGDIPMRIAADGTWFYQGGPIGRIELVKLFATVLKFDTSDNSFWLATPAEMARIEVEDAPFLAVEATARVGKYGQAIDIRTNLDDMVTIDNDHPLIMRVPPSGGEPVPYITIRPGLEAKATRSVYYHLAELAEELVPTEDAGPRLGVWSDGGFFVMGSVED